MGLFDGGDDPHAFGDDRPDTSMNADLDCEPQNDYVSEKRVEKIDDMLDDGEKVHYLAKATGEGLAVGGETKYPSKGSILTAATDRRVVSKVPYLSGSEEFSVPYDSITSVDVKSGLMKKRLLLRTTARTYGIGVGNLSDSTYREMGQFIRSKASGGAREEADPGSGTDPSARGRASDDPLDKLERLRDLKEKGALSEREFEEKKAELLDEI